MWLIVILSCVVLLRAQVPTPCETPRLWEGNILRVDRSNRTLHRLDQRVKISYDEIGQRIREVDEYSFSSNEPLYEVISLYQTGKEYRINLKKRQCNVSTITGPFIPYGIPNGATFDGYATIGAAGISGEFLNIQSWSIQEGQEKLFGTVTTPDCYPVESSRYSPPTSFVTSTYFDLNLGIRDVNVFIPPDECPKD